MYSVYSSPFIFLELVQHADKVLGVMMKNSASRVQDMTLEDAMEFIVSQQY